MITHFPQDSLPTTLVKNSKMVLFGKILNFYPFFQLLQLVCLYQVRAIVQEVQEVKQGIARVNIKNFFYIKVLGNTILLPALPPNHHN